MAAPAHTTRKAVRNEARESTEQLGGPAMHMASSTSTKHSEEPETLNNRGASRSRIRDRSAKSIGSRTSLSSMPVIVRTYSGSGSRPSSKVRRQPAMSPDRRVGNLSLPKVEEFSFQNILRAADTDVQAAIDAIAEICAKSRMSLADEYAAHLPPQGEITADGRTYHAARGHRTAAADRSLPALPEASSSSERLAGDSRSSTGSGKGKGTAYGSLKNIIVGAVKGEAAEGSKGVQNLGSRSLPLLSNRSGGEPSAQEAESSAHAQTHPRAASWAVSDSQHPEIALASGQVASPMVSLESTAENNLTSVTSITSPKGISAAAQRPRSATIASWFPWRKRYSGLSVSPLQRSHAETTLKDLLQAKSLGKNKAPAGVS